MKMLKILKNKLIKLEKEDKIANKKFNRTKLFCVAQKEGSDTLSNTPKPQTTAMRETSLVNNSYDNTNFLIRI